MQEFEPRLLMPGAPDIPCHIAVSHESAVYENMRDPEVTAAIWVPRWSSEASAAFARLADAPFDKSREHASHHILQTHPMPQHIRSLHEYLANDAAHWLLAKKPGELTADERAVTQEVAECQLTFVLAAQRLLQPDPARHEPWTKAAVYSLDAYSADPLIFNPARPEVSCAHIDPYDQALFVAPYGTILADQSGREYLSHRRGPQLRVAIEHFAGRLWQSPAASPGMWRGGRGPDAQYHVVPQMPRPMQRYKQFVHP